MIDLGKGAFYRAEIPGRGVRKSNGKEIFVVTAFKPRAMRQLSCILIIIVALVACNKKKDNNGETPSAFQFKGILTGIDASMCACCGGVFMAVDGDPKTYRVQSLGTMNWVDITALQFPRPIEFNFTRPASDCANAWLVDISEYRLP